MFGIVRSVQVELSEPGKLQISPNPRANPPGRRPIPNSEPGSYLHVGEGITGSALQMTSRLRDHIERLDSGVAYAADDLAVVLRAMLCASKGNRVLRRIYEGLNVEEPKVLLSKPPASGDNVIFSVGSLP